MTRPAHLIAAAVVAIAVTVGPLATVAGAGSNDAPTPKEWANDVCSSIDTWIKSVESTVDGLKDADSVEDAASDAIDGIKDATDQLLNDFDDLDKPQTKNAKKVKQTLSNLGDELDQNMESVQDALSDPGDNAVSIASTFAIVGTQLQQSVDDVKSAGETLKSLGANHEIQQAFKSASSCKALKQDV